MRLAKKNALLWAERFRDDRRWTIDQGQAQIVCRPQSIPFGYDVVYGQLGNQHDNGCNCQPDQRPLKNNFHRLTCDLGVFFIIFDAFIFF